MDVSLFDFDLPESAIALRPASPRDSARLLHIGVSGDLTDRIVRDLPNVLRAGDVLVFNETKVFPAAFTAIRPAREHGGGGDVSVTVNLHKDRSLGVWDAFVRPAKRVRIGDVLHFDEGLKAVVVEKREGGDVSFQFNATDDALLSAFERCGAPPLPPYIARKRAPDGQDVADYQTVYAKETGSVAAPTAGLHFTPELLERLEAAGVQSEKLILHVGAGTFLPVKSDNTDDHDMHSEWFTIDTETVDRLNAAKADGRRVIAVGTTALRALESASQSGTLEAQSRDTDIFITPGYQFQTVDGLMTNFHLPKSTLFMLVSALAGREVMQAAYAHAIETGYRFYSYGDSSLIWKAG
ncbi:tRNA preQ1(34) S-adenosylmethionine ribosyltransferase-isomerase QueA [Litorimonas sp. WD9-15]|uniref:tRNA preQ1(34) S-adenosylmethionine ribosyltransferase-isomerase QueA n=1 Tax=Litorimonas sp. WD9-15 TaxID=3418716 RepID=UPI003D07D5D3